MSEEQGTENHGDIPSFILCFQREIYASIPSRTHSQNSPMKHGTDIIVKAIRKNVKAIPN